MKNRTFGLCKGRHDIPGVNEYVFEEPIIDPTLIVSLQDIAYEKLFDIRHEFVDIYVTGLSVALVAVINVCQELDINLTLWHYDKVSGNYYPQKVIKGGAS